MLLSDIFAAISLGRKLVTTIADLRRDIQSVRAGNTFTQNKPRPVEALESRLSGIESQARQQHARVIALEQSLSDVLHTTEALAERVSQIFWIASVASGLALIGVILSVIALARTFR